MQWHVIARRWNLFALSARARWPRITLREFEMLAGDRTRLRQKLHAAYGLSLDDADDEIARWQESLAVPA